MILFAQSVTRVWMANGNYNAGKHFPLLKHFGLVACSLLYDAFILHSVSLHIAAVCLRLLLTDNRVEVMLFVMLRSCEYVHCRGAEDTSEVFSCCIISPVRPQTWTSRLPQER